MKTMQSRVVAIGIVCNVASTVGVVLANKHLWNAHDFHFMIFLSFLHFLCTTLITRLLLHIGFFEYKSAKLTEVLPVALGSLGSVAFMNLNLAYNTVGFYQISKLMCIPCTLGLQFLLFGKTASCKVRFSLLVVLLGVGIATVSDVSINQRGFIFATIAVVFTALGQIFTGSKQKELGLDAMQLLYHASPIIAAGMVPLVFLFDDTKALKTYEFTVARLGWVLFTCFLAIGVNMSNYVVIGKTSPVTYQVVGHSKTCLILVLGFIFFNADCTFKMLLGIVVALTGVFWYGEIKRTEVFHSATPGYASVPMSNTNKPDNLDKV